MLMLANGRKTWADVQAKYTAVPSADGGGGGGAEAASGATTVVVDTGRGRFSRPAPGTLPDAKFWGNPADAPKPPAAE